MRHPSVRTLFTTMTAAAQLASMNNGSKAAAFASARVLVTGGAGYIGSHTCLELIKAGEKVREGDKQDIIVTHSPVCVPSLSAAVVSLAFWFLFGVIPVWRSFLALQKATTTTVTFEKNYVGGDIITTYLLSTNIGVYFILLL